jgi:hypothetical protein
LEIDNWIIGFINGEVSLLFISSGLFIYPRLVKRTGVEAGGERLLFFIYKKN